MKAQIIFAHIRTMDFRRPTVGAVVHQGGRILWAGNRDEALSRYPEGELLDYGDMTLLPGFLDTHVHAVSAGVLAAGCDLSGAEEMSQVLEKLREADRLIEAGRWLFAGHFQDKRIREKRMPTRSELDSVSADRPIFVYHNDCHPYSFNTPAIQALGLRAETEGVCSDDGVTPNGIVVDPACADVEKAFFDLLDPGEFAAAYENTERQAVAHGITTIFAKEYLRTLKVLWPCRKQFMTTIKPMMRTPGGCADTADLERLIGDEELKNETTVCTFLDGAFDGWSAANFEPYEGQPLNYGMLYNEDDTLYRYFKLAMEHGLQVSAHAIGDRAIEQYLRVMARLQREFPTADARPRIEHFEMPTESQIRRAAEMGIALGMQPLLIEVCEGMDLSGYLPYVGERVRRCSPYRSVLDAGCLVGGGSDHPVTDMDPLHAIDVAMNNPVEAERIDCEAGLRMFTCDAAKIGFLENRKGRILEGLDADFVILSGDPVTEGPGNVRVAAVYSRGRKIYEAEDTAF